MLDGASPTAQAPLREQRILVIVAVVVAAFAVYAVRSADADLWGHLRYGKHILDNGGSIGTDPFSYTTAGQTWFDHEYLSQVVLWQTYALAGPLGLILLKCVVGGLTLYLVYRSARLGCDDARIWAPLFVLLAAGMGRWLLFRPQLFTFLFLAAFIHELFRHLLGKSARLWLLPILMIPWCNMHGGFLAGFGVVGLALLLRAAQSGCRNGLLFRTLAADVVPLTAVLAGCGLASLVNPFGFRLWTHLRNELGFPWNRVYIQEWQAIHLVWNFWPALVPFFGLLAILVLLTLLAGWNKRIADLPAWAWLLSCVPLSVMAFQSNRHIPVELLWSAPVLGLLARAAQNEAGKEWKAAWLGVTGFAGVMGMMTIYGVMLVPRPEIAVGRTAFGENHPDRAVAFMKATGLKGKVCLPLQWGSYVTWELYPDVNVSADGRNITVYGANTLLDNFHFFSDDTPDLDMPRRLGSDFLLAPATDSPGLSAIRQDRHWTVLYEDRDAVLFTAADRVDLIGRQSQDSCAVPSGAIETFPGECRCPR